MMTISALTLSYHAYNDRADRIALVDKYVGWGQIVKEAYYNQAYHCLTDTGVVLVVDDARTTIITLYMVDRRRLHLFYKSGAPQYLLSKVKYNMRRGWVECYTME